MKHNQKKEKYSNILHTHLHSHNTHYCIHTVELIKVEISYVKYQKIQCTVYISICRCMYQFIRAVQ